MIRRLAAGVLLASGSVAALAAEVSDPAQVLAKMSKAAREVNYQGVIVYQTRNRLDTLKVVHGVHDGVELERVKTLTGTPSEIVKRDGKVMCILPKDRQMTLDRPTPKGLFPTLTPERLQQISSVYHFESIGTTRIAGRPCEGISIMPRDEFRYGYQIWADQQTMVPLKVNLVSRNGAVLEQMMFTEVEFPEQIPESAFEVDAHPEPGQRIVRAEEQGPRPPEAVPQPRDWRFTRLPPGFKVTMRDVRPTPDGKGIVEHILISDGLSAISVFSARMHAPAGQSFEGQSQMGAVHAFGRIVGTIHVTVVGEAPPETVRLIGESVEPDDAQVGPVEADLASKPAEAPAAAQP
ncbi:MAG: MucB/RseB C-terminal domain-containing protein [Nevskiales bacterium]|nr:MucB/RseB C-terminal domain-containing protein [Nevskiales bacterium]